MIKPPRRYAFDYLAATTPEGQQAAVAGCPPEWRDLVRFHVKLIRERVAGDLRRPDIPEEKRRARQAVREARATLSNLLNDTGESNE